MIKYGNRELSERLGINFQKWKRWAREFLPGDTPQGYAREYTPNEAFYVFLGGYLVGNLKYQIPQARRILSDILKWISERVCPEPSRKPEGVEKRLLNYDLYIFRYGDGFFYQWKGMIEQRQLMEYEDDRVKMDLYIEGIIPMQDFVDLKQLSQFYIKMIPISSLLRDFKMNVGIK